MQAVQVIPTALLRRRRKKRKRRLYRKDPAQEVFYAAGGCNYHDDSFEFTGNMIENGGMPFELTGEYKINKDALTLKFQGYDVPDWLSDSEDFKRVADSQVHVTTMDEVKHTAEAKSIPLCDTSVTHVNVL